MSGPCVHPGDGPDKGSEQAVPTAAAGPAVLAGGRDDPDWSPDGLKLVIESDQGGNWQI